MEYKVGDRVKIKSLDWYNKNKSKTGFIPFDYANFMPEMSRYCGEILTIKQVVEEFESYLVLECGFAWTDEMIERLVEEENVDCEKCGLTRNSTRCLFMDNCPHNKQKNIIEIPKDWVLKDENGNVINATKIVLEKKKKEYPKTYEECCKVLEIEGNSLLINTKHITDYERDLGNLMGQLHRLIICCDAYWKIAGEEMRLGKPWEPDYNGTFEHGTPIKYVIYNIGTHIVKERKSSPNHILSFPTPEMRDAFYENFKEEIESCKELL